VDFHPAQNRVGSRAGTSPTGMEAHITFCYMPSFDELNSKRMFQDYFLDVLINCTRKAFFLSLHSLKTKQGCHHGFARDKYPSSTTYVPLTVHFYLQGILDVLTRAMVKISTANQ